MPITSSDLPKAGGPRQRFVSVLLRMGFTYALSVTSQAVVSYTALPPLPVKPAVHFCCTFPGVTSARRYLASCPVKPGLSSPAAFRYCGSDHLSYSNLNILPHFAFSVYTKLLGSTPCLHSETASADKFPDNGILRNILTADSQHIIQEFQQPFGLNIFLTILWYLEQDRLRILF